MNIYRTALLSGLLVCTQLVARHTECFQQYPVTLYNQSGGIATVAALDGIGNISRRSKIPKNGVAKLYVNKRGARLTIIAGPEDNKTKRTIQFYSPLRRFPSLTLMQKGDKAEGFSEKMITYSVKIENHSDGIARILETCDTSARTAAIPDDGSVNVTVKPAAQMVVEYGPEDDKTKTNVIFGEPTGTNPTLTLSERGWFSPGARGKDLKMHTQAPKQETPLGILYKSRGKRGFGKKVAVAAPASSRRTRRGQRRRRF